MRPTRGPDSVCTFKQMSRVLAGFPDGRADEGVGAGPASLRGLTVAHENDWTAPAGGNADEGAGSGDADADTEASAGGEQVDGKAAGRHTSVNTPTNEPDEKPGGKAAKDSRKADAPKEEGK